MLAIVFNVVRHDLLRVVFFVTQFLVVSIYSLHRRCEVVPCTSMPWAQRKREVGRDICKWTREHGHQDRRTGWGTLLLETNKTMRHSRGRTVKLYRTPQTRQSTYMHIHITTTTPKTCRAGACRPRKAGRRRRQIERGRKRISTVMYNLMSLGRWMSSVEQTLE